MNVDGAPLRLRAGARWLPLVLLLVALAAYLPTVSKGGLVTDSQAAAAGAWRIATTGSPWMEGVPVSDLEGTRFPGIWIIDAAHDHRVHARTPGVILAGVPFYWLLNNDPLASDFDVWVGGVAAACFTAAAGLLIFHALRSKVSAGAAFSGAAALLFATPVWSVNADAMWTHTLTVFAIAGAIWASTRGHWAVAGAFLAIGIFARAHVAVIAAVVGLYVGWRRRDWLIVIRVGASSAVGLLLLAAWNRAVFGSWTLSSGYSHQVTDVLPGNGTSGSTIMYNVGNVFGFLGSPDRGLLVWTPVILLLVPSMVASWKHFPDWVRAFALSGLVYTVVQLRLNVFHGGQGIYGYRLALELLICLTPALVCAYKGTATATRLVIGGVLGLQFAAIAIGAITNSYQLKDVGLITGNAYLLALNDHPFAFGLFTAACVVSGVLATAAALRLSLTRRLIPMPTGQ